MPIYTARFSANITFRAPGSGQPLTSSPATLLEFAGSTSLRTRYDLSACSQMRVVTRVNTAGSVNSELRVQYSTDESTWSYLDGVSGPSVSMATGGTVAGAWATIAAAARADVILRVVSFGGDGAASPSVANLFAQVR